MKSSFIEQVQILMHAQQIKCAENVFGKSNYMWLCSKKTSLIWMSTKDEYLIRHALTKVTPEQQIQVMKKVLTWLDLNPEIHSLKIPEMCLLLLNEAENDNLIKHVTLSRMNSLRTSFRRLSLFSNLAPNNIKTPNIPRRAVTFNEKTTVYNISLKKK